MSSASGPVSHSNSFPEIELEPVHYEIVATRRLQNEIVDAIRDAFDKAVVEAVYHMKDDGVHVLVQVRGRKPRSQ